MALFTYTFEWIQTHISATVHCNLLTGRKRKHRDIITAGIVLIHKLIVLTNSLTVFNREMLALGMSRPWTEALEVLTGQTEIDTSAIHEYFAPLIEWLEEETKDEVIGWDEEDEVEEPTEERFWQDMEFYNEMKEMKRWFNDN